MATLAYSVAISGDTIVVGAPGEDGGGSETAGRPTSLSATRHGADNWGQVPKLTAGSYAEDKGYFGGSVAISGDTVVVGAYREDGPGLDRGAAYVFERNQGGAENWGQVRRLTASTLQEEVYFGISVGISGDTVVVGAYKEDGAGDNRGAAYIYERNQGGADHGAR